MKDYDIVIIGKGPAGISAALYTVRGGLKTLLIGSDKSYLAKAEKIENYYGFPNGISGKELLSNGVLQAKNIGTEILDDEVTSLEIENGFNIKTSNDMVHARAVLISTGLPPRRPKIEGVKDFEGKGISYCTTCDGFFYRKKKVGVLGNGNYAAQEAGELEPFTKDITIFTNGEEPKFDGEYSDTKSKYKIEKRKIKSVSGNDVLGKINFDDGEEKIDGLFIAAATASSVDFATKLGVMVNNGAIIVDPQMKTNIEGIFAAGDCIGGIKQVSVAVGEGAVAGKSIIEFVKKQKA